MKTLLEKLSTSYGRKASRVRTIDPSTDGPEPNKRAFLRGAAAAGGSLPAMYFLLDRPSDARAQSIAATPAPSSTEGSGTTRIVRDFNNSRLELVRLLKEAAEIEHSLMIQYLYAAFSGIIYLT